MVRIGPVGPEKNGNKHTHTHTHTQTPIHIFTGLWGYGIVGIKKTLSKKV